MRVDDLASNICQNLPTAHPFHAQTPQRTPLSCRARASHPETRGLHSFTFQLEMSASGGMPWVVSATKWLRLR